VSIRTISNACGDGSEGIGAALDVSPELVARRRRPWCAVWALACVVALAGCNRVSTSGAPAHGNSTTIHGVVRYAVSNDINTLNPVLSSLAIEEDIEEAIFSGLVKLDDGRRLVPDLATEIPSAKNGGVSADGRTITYHLRRGVLWQDGQPLRSADVAFTFAKITDPSVNAPLSAPYAHVEKITTPDDFTVLVRLKAPWAPAVGQLFLSGYNGNIIPKHLLEHSTDFNRDAFGVHPVGSGPMRLVRWERGARLVLVPNRRYFGGAPKINELDVLIVPDANTRLTMLTSRELDVAQIGAPNQTARLRGFPGYELKLVPYTSGNYLIFNVSRGMLTDRRLRLSLAMALDRPRLTRTSYTGTAVVAKSFIPPFSWAFDEDNASPPYDPPRAAALLAQAGWLPGADGVRSRDGRRLMFTLSVRSGSTVAYTLAQEIQQSWRAIGADVAIKTLPINVLVSPSGLWTTGKFDIALTRYVFDPDPDRSANLGSQSIGTRGANFGRYVSAQSDGLTADAVAVYARAARKPLYARLQRLWNTDLPVLPIAWEDAIYMVNSDLRDFRPEPIDSDFWNVQEWHI